MRKTKKRHEDLQRLLRALTARRRKQAERAIPLLLNLPPEWDFRLLPLVSHPKARVRRRVCAVLGELGGYDGFTPHFRATGVPALLQRLACDPKPFVRATAAHALQYQVRPGMIPALCYHANDSSAKVRRALCHPLGRVLWESGTTTPQLHQAQKVLLQYLSDTDALVREWSAFYVHQGKLDTPEIREALWGLVDDPVDDVRAEACAALGFLGDRRIVPFLIRQFESGKVWLWNLEAAEKLGDAAFLPALKKLRKGYAKKHWFGQSVRETIKQLENGYSSL